MNVVEVPVSKSPEAFLAIDGLRLEAFEVDHFPVVPAFGYRAVYDGRTAVLSGDTAYCESLARASEGCDMLVCEALNVEMLEQIRATLRAAGRDLQAGLMDDVSSYHIGTKEIARLARESGVGEVVLSHIIPPIPNDAGREQAFMAGMADLYGGPLRMARDMQRIPVLRRGDRE